MNGTDRHAPTGPARFSARLSVAAAVAALAAAVAMVAAMMANSVSTAAPPRKASAHAQVANAAPAIRRGYGILLRNGVLAAVTFPALGAAISLTADDHQDCPAAAAACVDLIRHITWLQAGGRITFGPVPMEPGEPGGQHQTPRGTFQVEWKAGPSLVSNTYHEPMPWATFFAPGGIAFHGGSLTAWSHGCVHLTIANAYYYNEHLPVGAEVVVF
jgi:lipoprotein-anchoring transpeptidase ErfK/SrfK